MEHVSVVIPTRNRAALLSEALRSVLWQRGVNLEVVVVDDGSTDATPELLASVSDRRVQVLRHSTARGVSIARNSGIARCRGPWIAFIDDDDLWSPEKLHLQLRAMAESGARWSCVGVVNVNQHLRIIGWKDAPSESDLAPNLLSWSCVPGGGSGVIASTDLIELAGDFDPRLACLADWDMWLRLAQHSPVATVNRPLLAYRSHPGAMSLDTQRCDGEFDYISDKYAPLRDRLGAELNVARYRLWTATMRRRSRRRIDALRILLRVRSALSHTEFSRLLAITCIPGASRIVDSVRRRRVPADWYAEAESWLSSIRTLE